jgi:hypothetical protein
VYALTVTVQGKKSMIHERKIGRKNEKTICIYSIVEDLLEDRQHGLPESRQYDFRQLDIHQWRKSTVLSPISPM